jgi:hypothetical protein
MFRSFTFLHTTLNESPRVVGEGIVAINSSRIHLRLQTACLTAPESSGVFLLLCAPSMLLPIACYLGKLKHWATLGEHGTLCRRGKCKLSTEMWLLIYGLYFRDCSTVRYMSPCHFFFRCSAVSFMFYLFIYGIVNVSKGVHSHAKHCLSQRCLVSAQFSGYHQTCISKTHEKYYTNYL